MELDIVVKWSQEDIENMLRERLEEEGLLLVPQPCEVTKKTGKGKKEPDDVEKPGSRYFVWPHRGKSKVKARAIISPRAQKATQSKTQSPLSSQSAASTIDGDNDTPLDRSMLPDGTNVDALEAAVKLRPLMPGESRTPPEPSKVGR